MKNIIFVIALALIIQSCSQTKSKVSLPYKTSLGNLIRVERKDTVKTMRTPDMGQFRLPEVKTHLSTVAEDLYLLSFEGVDSITSINKGIETKETVSFNFEVDLPIYGEETDETSPEFVGYLTEEGILTSDNSRMTLLIPESDTGRYKMITHFPVSKISMLYKLPKNTSALFLKDGKSEFQIR